MRDAKINQMKAIDAAYLTGSEKLTIENGILERAGISEIEGVAIVDAIVKFRGGGCAIGGNTVGQYNRYDKTIRGSRYGLEALLWLMAVAGVDRSDQLGGQYVRVAFDEEGRAKYIGHIYEDTWLSLGMLAEGIKAEDEARKNG